MMNKVPRMPGARRASLLALGVLLALGFHHAAPQLRAHPGVAAVHAESVAPAFMTTAAPQLASPRELAWSVEAAPQLVGVVSVRSLYLRDCALRL
jgi:hypothetical protein